MAPSLDVPHYSYDDLRAKAESFLRHHEVWDVIPVDIEHIIDVQIGINIIPVPGLLRTFDIDAFIASDLSSITIDEFIYYNRENRYRFSLAHEIAHAVLHRDVFSPFSFRTIDSYSAFLSSHSDKDIGWIEWQAYCLGGLLLVPKPHLEKKFLLARRKAESAGLSLTEHWDVAADFINHSLGREFHVSAQVIEKRVKYDRLCKRFL